MKGSTLLCQQVRDTSMVACMYIAVDCLCLALACGGRCQVFTGLGVGFSQSVSRSVSLSVNCLVRCVLHLHQTFSSGDWLASLSIKAQCRLKPSGMPAQTMQLRLVTCTFPGVDDIAVWPADHLILGEPGSLHCTGNCCSGLRTGDTYCRSVAETQCRTRHQHRCTKQ